MNPEDLEKVLSPKARLEIASLVSVRPRTLSELSRLTGMTVQGVLKHLSRLEKLGLVGQTRVKAEELRVRKVYSIKETRIGDFSDRDFVIVRATKRPEPPADSGASVEELESLSADALVQKRRVKDEVRRLGRTIDELMALEARIGTIVRALPLADEERLLLYAAFTEDSLEDAEKTLREHYRLREPRRALEKALSSARKLGKK